nr:uncharacterized protein LOC128694834 [Cherax quadricarinatus]
MASMLTKNSVCILFRIWFYFRVPKNCMCAFTLNCDTYYPDPNYRLHSGRGQRPTKYLQVSVEQKQRETQAELEHSKENLKACHQKMIDMRAEISELKNECNASRKKSLSIKQAMDKLHCKQADLRNQKPSPPTDVCQLEEDIRQQETVLKEAQDNFQKIKEDIASSKDAFTKASSEFENVTKEEKDQFKIAENEKVNYTYTNFFFFFQQNGHIPPRQGDLKRKMKVSL